MKKALAILAVLAALGAAAGAGVVWLGLYDISATDQHLRPTYAVLDVALRRSALRRAVEPLPADFDAPRRIPAGAAIYRDHCVQCHGAPGVAPEPFALGLTPSAANLALTGREWEAGQIFWVVSEGLKMTGMPAWRFRFPQDDLWSLTAFVKRELPRLSPEEWRELAARTPAHEHRAEAPAGEPDPDRGRTAMLQYACVTCHEIPGVVGANAPVGPPLARMATRDYIAGILPNTRENMVRWLRFPQEVDAKSAMPDLGVTERDALDMAAYLSTLR